MIFYVTSKIRPNSKIEPNPPSPTIVYCYKEDGEIVYVGITWQPKSRRKSHTILSSWWHSGLTYEVMEEFSTREEAASIELSLIRKLHPKYNGTGNKCAGQRWCDELVSGKRGERGVVI